MAETKNTHYIAVIKTNQPTAHRQLATLPRQDIAVQHTRLARDYETIPARSETVIRLAMIGIMVRADADHLRRKVCDEARSGEEQTRILRPPCTSFSRMARYLGARRGVPPCACGQWQSG
ncbi:hypothetical protein [Streptomyces sp. NBC_00019]|uniref:hypothetical protein n=1 Tax=Streptomyces sp. NBC_00019 TaxID=2975623 RepID=UPI003866352E